MKARLKKIGQRIGKLIAEGVFSSQERKRIGEIGTVDKGMQILLALQYRQFLHLGLSRPQFADIEFSAFSQNGEDGILLFLFSLLGTTNRKAIEICAGDGIECNAANLIINHGWTGLLIDGDQHNIDRGREFYAHHKDTWLWPPALCRAWVTAENVNSLIRANGFEGDIDLLSLDLDGVDYWIWRAIDCIAPRVVVLEYQDIWGPEQSVTVPYSPEFRGEHGAHGLHYGGASLQAFVKLGREKGYRLVGSQRYGFNAFFVRCGIGEDILPEVAPHTCLGHPRTSYGAKHRLPEVILREWTEV